jgi:hypothetical protein
VGRRIVEDGAHTGPNQVIRHVLCFTGWNGQHRNFDLVLLNHIHQIGNIVYDIITDLCVDLFRVAVEYEADAKTTIAETLVASNGMPKVAGAD